ncbi:uncharacterized protein LOC135173024 [Diachasmimorpha longicaudata]|uniref:uncharacterized protein LOC135173024 n=1 Tax=Diachasmimorpha longicaudata TaxID=58733 RepID=UPI0030B8A9DE
MEYGSLELVLCLTALLLLYYYATAGLDYWKKRGVPGPRPLPAVGNFAGVFLQREAIFQAVSRIYKDYKQYPYAGGFKGLKPMLVVNDLDLIKNVLIKDFSTFAGRGLNADEGREPLTDNLFALDGPRWKDLRKKLTPVFTSGKLKHMFELILECADHFEKYLKDEIGTGKVIECKEPIARFTTDVIGSCAFGLDMSAIDSNDSEFRRIGKKIFEPNFRLLMSRLLRDVAPWIYNFFKLRITKTDVEDFFVSVVRDTIALREKQNIVRHDLIDTLISMKNNNKINEFQFTDLNLTAQAFVFFVAGFETSSTAISFALLELAHVPEIQEKLRNEILESLKECGGNITYEIVTKMKYLDMVVQETLRKNPPVPILLRRAYQSYKVPETGLTIDKGIDLLIPSYAIQHDPEYYPEPERFDPERFSEEAKSSRHPMTYLPFGDGPKNCIGERFGLYQTKIGIIKILKNYRVKPTDLTPFPIVVHKSPPILSVKGGVHLKFESILFTFSLEHCTMEYGSLEVLLGVATLFLLYYFATSGLDYWTKKGVPGPRPLPIFGNFASVFLNQKAPFQVFEQIYKDYKQYPYAGGFRGLKPMLVVNDLDLIKHILIKEFSTFAGRGLHIDEKNEPLSANLFTLDGPRWKDLRKKLTPVFTTGKIKHMFDLILECSDQFEKHLEKQIGNGKVIECKEPIARFTTDVIGSCAFGLDVKALESNDSEFRRIGKKIFEPNFKAMLKRLVKEIAPLIAKIFALRATDIQVQKFFISVIKDTISLRKRENIVRHDFVDALISMKESNDVNEWKFTDENLAAQALVFFAAGFETSSTTISFALLELSHAPQFQEILRKEILETLKKCDGKLTYTIVNEMTYLDKVVQETLRKDPPATLLTRHAFESYKVPGTDFTIDKGMAVFIPVYAIHHDPEYYPDPEVFNPERFSEEAKHLRHPMAHIPFGDGPKNCIGDRFALYQTKVGIIKILKNYRVKPTKLSPLPYKINISSVVLSTKDGIHLEFEPVV